MAGVLFGGTITVYSAILGHWTRDWWSSAFVNIGTAVLLAGVLSIYAQRITAVVENVKVEISSVKGDLVKTQEDVRSLREQAREWANNLAQQQDEIYGRLINNENPSLIDVIEVMRQAEDQKLVGRLGFRVRIGQGAHYVRFIPGVASIKIAVEDDSGDVTFSRNVQPPTTLAEVLGAAHTAITSRGGSDYDPVLPVEVLGKNLVQLKELQRKATPGTVDNVQELLDGNWYITDNCLWHKNPDYAIAWENFERQNWERHLGEKTWYDEDTGDWALYVASVLLGRQMAPPF
jgi:hypothetical protein